MALGLPIDFQGRKVVQREDHIGIHREGLARVLRIVFRADGQQSALPRRNFC